MSAPRGFITLRASLDGAPCRVRAGLVATYGPEMGADGAELYVSGVPDLCSVRETPEQIDALIAAAQGDAPTTPEPLPPLVESFRVRLAYAIKSTTWPDMVNVYPPTEEARALLAWLDRGRS